jgi:hypothetical protein
MEPEGDPVPIPKDEPFLVSANRAQPILGAHRRAKSSRRRFAIVDLRPKSREKIQALNPKWKLIPGEPKRLFVYGIKSSLTNCWLASKAATQNRHFDLLR